MSEKGPGPGEKRYGKHALADDWRKAFDLAGRKEGIGGLGAEPDEDDPAIWRPFKPDKSRSKAENQDDARKHWEQTMKPIGVGADEQERLAEQERYNNLSTKAKLEIENPPGLWAQSRAEADRLEKDRFDPEINTLNPGAGNERPMAYSGVLGGDKNTTGDETIPFEVSYPMAVDRHRTAERVAAEEWPLDGLRRRVDGLPGDIGQWREDRKARREEKARAAVEAASAKTAAAGAKREEELASPEGIEAAKKAKEYAEQLENQRVHAHLNQGISLVEVDRPDEALRRALYEVLGADSDQMWLSGKGNQKRDLHKAVTERNEFVRSHAKIRQGFWGITGMPERIIEKIVGRTMKLAPSNALPTDTLMIRDIPAGNGTIIRESWHKRKRGVKGGGAGEMSLSSTMLIRAEDGAYKQTKSGKLVESDQIRAHKSRAETELKSPYAEGELPAVAVVEQPDQGPASGSVWEDKPPLQPQPSIEVSGGANEDADEQGSSQSTSVAPK